MHNVHVHVNVTLSRKHAHSTCTLVLYGNNGNVCACVHACVCARACVCACISSGYLSLIHSRLRSLAYSISNLQIIHTYIHCMDDTSELKCQEDV